MEVDFPGFAPEVFEWFAGLERDNSRAYFTATRERYEADVRGGLEAMLDELSEAFGGEVRMFRQHRDLRFTPDKSPYKTTTYGLLVGAPRAAAGLYAQLSSSGLYAGTGYYQLARDQLERFRDAVADERTGPQLLQAAAAAQATGLELAGERLRTAPRGYARDHPRIDLLRRADRGESTSRRGRHRARRRARSRRGELARSRAAQRVARAARRAERDRAAGAPATPALTARREQHKPTVSPVAPRPASRARRGRSPPRQGLVKRFRYRRAGCPRAGAAG